MKFTNIILLVLSLSISSIHAIGIIRDSEIEETLQFIADPLTKAANMQDIKIYLIGDDALNAFTYGGREIFIYSGLIKQFADIDVIRGVIAHEIGHIYGQHVSRQTQNIDLYNKVVLSSMAAAIGLAGLSKGNMDLALVPLLGGTHFADRSLLAYSRTFESSADQTAFKLLEKTGNSSKGMIQFFEYLSSQHRGLNINPYEQTHPLSDKRLNAIRNFYQKSKFKANQSSVGLNFRFERSAAKLIAFTSDLKRLDAIDRISNNDEINNYFNAIKYFRKSELNQAINYINILLKNKPTEPFYNELKGQILFEFGKKEALEYYDKACSLRSHDILLKLSKGIVGISIFKNDPQKLGEYYQDLKQVLEKEPENLTALFYLAIYYEKTNKMGENLLNTALIALYSGDLAKAKRLARAALKILKPQSPDWYKANDIILTER